MNNIKNVVTESNVSGEDIFNIVSAIEPILSEFPRTHAIVACLSLAVTMQKPNVTAEEIYAAVKGASEWICLFLSTTNGEEELTKEMLN